MVKKKVDSRIRTVISNGVKTRHRTFFVVVGDKGRDQVVSLHYMLSKASVKTRPSVLWCYKKDLGFTSNRVKRQRKMKRDIARGLKNVDEENPFELFIGCTDIKYTYYKDSHRVLGNTYGMCVLQDFAALTPNLLARTIETVEGGGIVVLLLNSMTSLKQLYTMSMDCHSRFRTEAHQDVVARFNERFLLSLGTCKNLLVVDDELNILPISSHIRSIKEVTLESHQVNSSGDYVSEQETELLTLKEDLRNTQPVGYLVGCTRSLDQAKAVLTFVEAISEKTLRNTVVLTAARGRGKSAALGIAVAGAVAYGYSNIFVTAPSPENLNTLFEMIFKGFDALDYKDHQDYEIIQSTNPLFNKAVVRVNIFRQHRQTIQYIQPQDHAKLAQAELLVIDEAAAIPLPVVKQLLGPYLVFMSSTVNGYEGTGRALSLKLVKQLREQSSATVSQQGEASISGSGNRVLRELTLNEPIRYALADPVEKWLNDLLCLDCTTKVPRIITGVPHPNDCSLFYVNRDSLFSFHKASEEFLQRMMSLYVSSHYKNSPNDLQLMSDAPGHHLFVLIGPVTGQTALPDILCVLQVCLEGEISKESAKAQMARGIQAAGDLIPWCVSKQFQNNEFASLSGARVVRIATHPELGRMGYATRALDLLSAYYEGKITNLEEEEEEEEKKDSISIRTVSDTSDLLTEKLAPRKQLPPLLVALSDRKAEALHYLGVSYGLTQNLFDFWSKSGFVPVYLRLTPNDLTGEHTCVMIKPQQGVALETVPNQDWLLSFNDDFKRRFLSLLGFNFRSFSTSLALSVLLDKADASNSASKTVTLEELSALVTEFDIRRLESYSRNMVDYHMILDLIPHVARLYFLGQLDMTLSKLQSAIILGLGAQHKTISDLEVEFGLPSNQIMALFNKACRKVSQFIRSLQEKQVHSEIKEQHQQSQAIGVVKPTMTPLPQTLSKELKEGGSAVTRELQQKHKANLLNSLNLEKYAISGTEEDWDSALSAGKGSVPGAVSMKKGDVVKRKKTHEGGKHSAKKQKKGGKTPKTKK
mmetsp:Transcript_15012/g.29501  ORF Transcript_15012/g.29501 Transcript_15012/m.29501 type:complete len:1039 (-) Transcript_15012:64-3180(-)